VRNIVFNFFYERDFVMSNDLDLVSEAVVGGGSEVKLGLDLIEVGSLGKMNVKALVALCNAEGLSINGKKDELVSRLTAKKNGKKNYSPRNTVCKICTARAVVKGTKKRPYQKGKVFVTRQIVCTGKHRHSYSDKRIEAV
jgi:hypothetical protein